MSSPLPELKPTTEKSDLKSLEKEESYSENQR